MKDLYYILGVGKNAPPAEIDNAYGILSTKLKPSNDNEHFLQNHFNEITEAYAILSNPDKRKTYDAALKRNHLKQLARFKAKTTNALIAVSIISVTGLVGFYLVNLINSHNGANKIIAADSVATIEIPKKHHRKKHHNKALIARNKSILKSEKITVKSNGKPALVVVAKPIKTLADTVKTPSKKPALIAALKPLKTGKDTLAKPIKNVPIFSPGKHLVLLRSTTQRDSSYITYLKNNLRDSVYMHQLADYMSPVVSVLAANTKVRVLEKGHSFYKIALNKETGYIPKWALVKP